MVTLNTMSLLMHLLCSGHGSFFLQLQLSTLTTSGWILEKTACYVCLNVLARSRVEPDNIALPIPAGLLCFMWCVFQLMAEVAVS